MPFTEEQKLEIVEKYKINPNCAAIGREYNVSNSTIHDILKRKNVKTIPRGLAYRKYNTDINYFDKIDTEEKAYFLGLLYADGCTEKYKITLGLQEKDKEIVIKFNKALKSNRPLQVQKYSNKKDTWQDAYKVVICDKIIAEQLNNLGCVPKKSLILKFPTEEQVPSYLIKHFIRGYFDGDGCFSVYKDKKGYKQYDISIVSTEIFLEKVKEIFQLLGVKSRLRNRKKYKNTRELRFGGRINVYKILDWLYQDATIFLERKYKKYIEEKI